MTRIIGVVEIQYMFDDGQIREVFGRKLTNAQVHTIADILAANVEDPEMDEDDVVELKPSNFNDCYYDMLAEVKEMIEDDGI